MLALARLAQVVTRAPGDDVAPVRDEPLEQGLHAQRARLPAVDGQQGGAEGVLEEGAVLVEVVQDHAGHRIALGLHHRADALAARLVAQVADALQLLLLHHLGDGLDGAGLVDLVGDLGHHDRVTAGLLVGLDLHLRAHAQDAAARLVQRADRRHPHDDPARRQLWRAADRILDCIPNVLFVDCQNGQYFRGVELGLGEGGQEQVLGADVGEARLLGLSLCGREEGLGVVAESIERIHAR